MSTATFSSEKEIKRSASLRPLVSSKCLLNLKSIVAHNVSSNSHRNHSTNPDKIIQNSSSSASSSPPLPPPLPKIEPLVLKDNNQMERTIEENPRKKTPVYPSRTTLIEYLQKSDGRKSLPITKKPILIENSHQQEVHLESPMIKTATGVPLIVEKSNYYEHSKSRKNPSTTAKIPFIPEGIPIIAPPAPLMPPPVVHAPILIQSTTVKTVELAIHRRQSLPIHQRNAPQIDHERTHPRVFLNSALNKSMDSSVSTDSNKSMEKPIDEQQPKVRPLMHYARLPHSLRNSAITAHHSPSSTWIEPSRPNSSRRSFPQAQHRRISVGSPTMLITEEISTELIDCCQSPISPLISKQNYGYRTNTRSSLTTAEKTIQESEERANHFRQAAQIREIMSNVAQRLTADLNGLYSELPLVDTHCHFDLIFDRLRIRHNDLTRYFQNYNEYYPPGLRFQLAIQVFWRPQHLTEDNWLRRYSKYLDDDRVYGSCGIHPHWSSAWTDDTVDDLERCLQHPKVVAIGEIGLDFGPKNECLLHQQRRAFEAQLKLAAKWSKPIVIHSRDAYEQTFELMKQHLPANHKIHLHCFVGTLDDVDLFTSYFTEMKFGFTPIITRNASHHPVLQQLDITQILSETDSPYFTPSELSHVTRCSHPGMVYSVIETIAQLRHLPVLDVALQLRENARQIYGI